MFYSKYYPHFFFFKKSLSETQIRVAYLRTIYILISNPWGQSPKFIHKYLLVPPMCPCYKDAETLHAEY